MSINEDTKEISISDLHLQWVTVTVWCNELQEVSLGAILMRVKLY